jgi:hypothetical protein
MKYSVDFSNQFAIEFSRIPVSHQTAVASFVVTYQAHGLSDQTKHIGRISPSWHRLPTNHPNYIYAKRHELWHYHVGLPGYSGNQSWGLTSDWLLHFQWPDAGNHITLVDLYQHYTWKGDFYLPPKENLPEEVQDNQS